MTATETLRGFIPDEDLDGQSLASRIELGFLALRQNGEIVGVPRNVRVERIADGYYVTADAVRGEGEKTAIAVEASRRLNASRRK